MKGVNIHCESNPVRPEGQPFVIWSDSWSTYYDWTELKQQIDLTVALGANAFRTTGSVHVVTSGRITRATYLERQVQVASYIASLGLFYYPTGFDGAGFDPLPTTAEAQAELVALGQALAPYEANILGFDVVNELPGWTVSAGSAFMAAVKAALPGVPFTSSGGQGDLDDTALRASLDALVDYFDFHLYNPFSVTAFDSLLSTTAKPVLIGEFGKPMTSTDAGITAHYGAAGAAMDRVLEGGRGLAGALQWSAWNYGPTSGTDSDFGMFAKDFTPRTRYTVPFAALPETG